MTRQDIWQKLPGVFREVFENDELEIHEDTTAADVDGWDSLNHVRLLLRVEQAFGLRFPSAAVAKLSRVKDLVDLIDSMQSRTSK